jgi:hypothetical protein
MAIGWKNESTRPAGRSTFGDNPPVSSKATKRYGSQGSKSDFPDSSTGENPARIHRDELPASSGARHIGRIGPPRIEQVGHAVDGSGRWISPTHDRELIGGAIQTHEPLKPQGMNHSATGGAHGKPSRVPVGKDESYRTRMDAGVLAGESDGGKRDAYTGGRGKIRP